MKVQSNYLHFSITIQLYRVSLFLSLCLPLSLFLVKGNTFSVTIYLSFVSHHSIAKYANVLRNLLCIIQTSPLFSLPLSTYSRVEIVYKLKLYLLCSLLIIIIIIIIIIVVVSFMHGIYTYIPETNCVPREYSVAAILLLLFMVLISLVSVLNLLYFCISTFRSMCAVPNMAVFCSSLTSCFPDMLLMYFLND